MNKSQLQVLAEKEIKTTFSDKIISIPRPSKNVELPSETEKTPFSKREIKIFHLSDIHYNGKNTEILENVLDRLVDEGPDYVLVTGDIVEGPTDDLSVPVTMIRNALKNVRQYTGRLPILRVVPGNHDFFYQGTYGFRRVTCPR